MNENVKVLVFGLDGATFKLLDPWLEGEKLPFLCRMRDEGVYGDLEVVLPTLSPLEWAGFFTGKNPAKLGLFGVSQIGDPRNPSEAPLINSKLIEGPKIWNLLNEAGKKVGIMNIPATYPPEPVDGFMITGMMTPTTSKKYYHPPELEDYLKDYKIGLEAEKLGELPDEAIDKTELLEELYSIHEKRSEAINAVLDDYPVDFFVVNFKEIDELQHLFWNEKDTLLKFYQKVDESMERIHKKFEPTHTVIMSDHGFHRAEEEYFYVNRWLEDKGYLERSRVGRIYNFLHPAFSLILKGKIRELIPEKLKTRETLSSVSGSMIEFAESEAYANMWGIYINGDLLGVDEKWELKEDLMEEMEKAENPKTGDKIFFKVYDREELYFGEHLEKLPELIFTLNPTYLPNTTLSHRWFEPRLDKPYLKGAHKADPYGIFLASGDLVREGKEIKNPHILDLAPTILHIFGAPVPDEIDGEIIRSMFSRDFL